ncbi:MFS transporter [Virgisporangium ochraceum]|uniref:MFS transporter n=1 Tax=Virgisporangium ochraceum TaxID=65505 RepID=A0A8J4EIQ2_9ACTN|nr:MFS transporter [Virgisporangium ochraceum]GIJ73497.1 MFS transporter [Virgisporangium ochraceum]
MELRTARIGTTAAFLLTGAVMAAWSTRIPAVQDRLHLTPSGLSVAILGLEGGAVIGLPVGGALVARFGSRRCLRVALILYALALAGPAVAGSLTLLALALGIFAAACSVVDVAMNAQGVELERRYGRPVLSSMHAGHSGGLLVGGVVGTGAAAAGVSPVAHFAAVGVAAAVAAALVTRPLVDEPRRPRGPALARPGRGLALLGVVAFCGFVLDGTAYNWTAVHLRTAHDAAPGVAALAFTVVALAQIVGRLAGDRLALRWGRARLVRVAGGTAALGAALAILSPGAFPALAGWAVFGLGLAVIAPVVFSATPGASDAPAPVAIAAVTTVGYLGSFTGPPLIGVVAGATSLPRAMWLLVAVAVVVSALAGPALHRRASGQ